MAFVGPKTQLQFHRAVNMSLVLPIDATPSAAGPVPPPQARSRGPTRGATTALRRRVGTPPELLLHPPPLFWTFHSISHRSCSCGPFVCAFRAIQRSHFSKPTSILVSYLLRLLPFFVPLSLLGLLMIEQNSLIVLDCRVRTGAHSKWLRTPRGQSKSHQRVNTHT